MNKNLFFLVLLFIVGITHEMSALMPPGYNKPSEKQIELRELCSPATASVELNINNVRALLLNGGDVWWNRDDPRYIIPNVTVKPVSSIFAAAVWIVGYNGGSIKGAGRMYGGNGNKHDWFPGPLNDLTGQVTVQECSNWDRFFEVRGEEIDKHIAQFNSFQENGEDYPESLIPLNVRGWPARGNPYFKSIYNWSLPTTTAALAPFYDYDGDGEYDPAKGDFPIIEVRGVAGACESTPENPVPPTYADQMFFWIYNDNGNTHSEFNGTPINMEVQVQGYGFKTNDQLNDMTFMRYKLVNRSPTVTDKCLFGWWVDSDLGCPDDDLIGCDSSRSLVYYYNIDGTDGNSGPDQTLCNAGGGSVNTYGRKVPIIGIDYFEGPTIDTVINGKEVNFDIGMTSFTYWNRESAEPGTVDPNNLQQLYYYMDAKWKDGTPFTFGGSGYKTGGPVTRYPFPDAPNDINGWSMKTVTNLPGVDRRTAQSTGPITLQSNKTNYLVVGVPWVPDQDYNGPNNAPSLTDLYAADDICQGLFDNCFKIFDGPDAPDVDVIELDRKAVLALSNDPEKSNNFSLNYHGFNPGISASKDTSGMFKFEGYMIYQVVSPDISPSDYNDPTKSRLFAQVDLKDTVTTLYNWTPVDNPSVTDPKDPLHKIWVPVLMVNGENKGLRTTFEVTTDLFADGDQRLVNHKKYYYTAVAYAYNNYKKMDYKGDGQRITFALGRRNSRVYTVIPRPIVDRVLNSDYGSGATVTRLDGEGNYKSFLELGDGERERLFDLSFVNGASPDRTIKYQEGAGPIAVKVYNPIDVTDGIMNVAFNDANPSDGKLDINSAVWNLTSSTGDTLVKAEKFSKFNETLIAEFGISIFFPNNDPGEDRDDVNGYIGQKLVYKDATKDNWLSLLRDGGEGLSDNPNVSLLLSEALNWINYVEKFSGNPDPKGVYEKLGFWPLTLALKEPQDIAVGEFLQPVPPSANIASTVSKSNPLSELNNVDIVFTNDRSKWSKCIVVETSNTKYSTEGLPAVGNAPQFSLRRSRSITKDFDADGNPVLNSNPDSTGMSWFPGYAIDVETGMRLNIFFGENSSYDPAIFGDLIAETGDNPNCGRDMIFNPGSSLFINANNNFQSAANFFAGGQHYIYVSKTKYNECATFLGNLKGQNPTDINKSRVLAQVTWVAVPLGFKMLSYKDGLIPQETIYKLRVNNSYKVPALADGRTGLNNGMPMYKIEIKDKVATTNTPEIKTSALDRISVVPNPYYAYSSYENTEISNIVKITNLPPKCVVTIYSLDGKFIRQFNRNEVRQEVKGEARGVKYAQVAPDIEWDLKNGSGITVGSGIYLIHIKSDDGERVIKWVGAIRQLEISGF